MNYFFKNVAAFAFILSATQLISMDKETTLSIPACEAKKIRTATLASNANTITARLALNATTYEAKEKDKALPPIKMNQQPTPFWEKLKRKTLGIVEILSTPAPVADGIGNWQQKIYGKEELPQDFVNTIKLELGDTKGEKFFAFPLEDQCDEDTKLFLRAPWGDTTTHVNPYKWNNLNNSQRKNALYKYKIYRENHIDEKVIAVKSAAGIGSTYGIYKGYQYLRSTPVGVKTKLQLANLNRKFGKNKTTTLITTSFVVAPVIYPVIQFGAKGINKFTTKVTERAFFTPYVENLASDKFTKTKNY